MARKKELYPLIPWLYDLILWGFTILVDLFFREVHPRGSWKIPRRGPVIFVAAPHANQFVDPLILMKVIRTEAHRRVAFLIAEKSMRRKFVGAAAHAAGSVPVGRALDSTKPATGKIYMPDPAKEPTLIRGVGTNFEKEAQVGGLVVLPSVNGTAANAEILEIKSAEEIKLKREFKGDVAVKQLTGNSVERNNSDEKAEGSDEFHGIKFKVAPKVDQSLVYDAVFDRLQEGGCVGIFPEGGSHDRTELLPLKPGVAIMALGSLAVNPDSGLKIIPCGMNYFHAHKFRSRAVVEFGNPLEVPPELVKLYQSGDRREATRQLLETVYQALVAVTVTCPDYETLMTIQAARRLYNTKGKKLPLPMVIELNRRLVKGYTQYKDDPRILALKKAVNDYNRQLWQLGVRDHQVQYAKFSKPFVISALVYRTAKFLVLSLGTLPGLFLFAPVFVASKIISMKKSREALAASTVKLQGKDVMATWKLLVSMALAPSLYVFYSIILTYWTYKNRVQGYVPGWVPLWLIPLASITLSISATMAALRFGETGMDIFKSLRPLVLSLNPSSSNTLVQLRQRRENLAHQVTDLINTLGPEMYPDFDHARIIADPYRDTGAFRSESSTPKTPNFPRTPPAFNIQSGSHPSSCPTIPLHHHGRSDSGGGYFGNAVSNGNSNGNPLPRNESLHNLAGVGLFASGPPSRSRSRSNSSGNLVDLNGMHKFSTLDSKDGLDEVSAKIRGAMRERSKQRKKSQDIGHGVWELASTEGESGGQTPESGGGGAAPQGKKDT